MGRNEVYTRPVSITGGTRAYDVAIICSGDEHYIPAVTHVKSIGKEVYIACSDVSSSRLLIDSSLGWVSLTKNADHLGELYYPCHNCNHYRAPFGESAPVGSTGVD